MNVMLFLQYAFSHLMVSDRFEYRKSLILLFGICFFHLDKMSAEDKAGNVTVKIIHEAWQNREKNLRAAVFEWREMRTYFKGSLPSASASADVSEYPPSDIVAALESNFRCNGDDFRFDTEGLQYTGTLEQLVPMTRVINYHKGFEKSFYQTHLKGDDNQYNLKNCPMGFEQGADRSTNWADPHFYPIVAFLRPLSSKFRRFDLQEYEVSATDAQIEETKCIVITPKQNDGPYRFEYWLDPARDFVVMRIQVETLGEMDLLVDIEYEKIEAPAYSGWVPKGWVSKAFLGKDFQTWQGEVSVVSREFPSDHSLADTTFSFPARTLVTQMGGERPGSAYLILADGSHRPVTPEEQMQSIEYVTLLQTAPNEGLNPLPSKSSRWRTYLILANVGVLLVIALAWIWHRARTNYPRTDTTTH